MPVFTVVKKTHVEEIGGVDKFTVNLKSPEGFTMKLKVDEAEYDSYRTGDTVSVSWSPYQKKLTETLQQ